MGSGFASPDEYFDDLSAEWLAAVARRRSRRSFTGSPVAGDVLDELDEVCERFRPYPDARAVLVREPAGDVFTGILGSYGRVSHAPHLLLFIGAGRSDFVDQHVGYTGEAAVLEATRLGLSTCWVGGFFRAGRAAEMTRLATSERVLAVSPVGHATDRVSLTERTYMGFSGAHKRVALGTIAPTQGRRWPEWAVAALETAHLAPSAMNRQPWRFRMDGSALVISKDSVLETPRVTKRLDCGIAMLHAELGALATGTRGWWTDLEGLDVARFDPEAPAE